MDLKMSIRGFFSFSGIVLLFALVAGIYYSNVIVPYIDEVWRWIFGAETDSGYISI